MMASPSSSPSTSNNVGKGALPSCSSSSSNGKAARALEALMWPHDLNSTMSQSSLGYLRGRYGIPEELTLIAPEPGQRAYDPISRGFALTLDTFEAGLHLPLHPRYYFLYLVVVYFLVIDGTELLALSDWGFGLRWAVRVIDNTAPALIDRERMELWRLKEILSASRAIREMTEAWLVEAGLSLAPREMVNLVAVRGGRSSSTTSSRHPAEPRIGGKEAPVELEASRPQKKAKTVVVKKPDPPATRPRAQNESYQARVMGELSEGRPSDPLVAQWAGLTRVWADGDASAMFVRGGLHPDMARELYTMPSDVLLGKSAKSLLWGHHYTMALADCVRDAGRALDILIDCNDELRWQIEEIHTGAAPEAVAVAEQRASDLEAEAMRLKSEIQAIEQRALDLEVEGTRLKSEVKAAEEQNKELQVFLRTTRTEVHLARKEAVVLTKKLEEARREAKAAIEALATETQLRPEKDKKLIEDYKESSGFQLDLVQSGQVTYEYGCRIALARFKVHHPGLEVEENPFASCPEDPSVDMPDDVPFDDSLEAPKE
ncbi:hypothetical protein C4D60_Mb03t12940 [Musa balbisiana]|uniref:Uncharacterized protein n=1 Tax=Musa balbisiana TaxID=52838 RepID=A0A4S8J9J2_MUSBA|nr:hypothetical protein C4D60_Mb03t12940 [Musa balbisiana]